MREWRAPTRALLWASLVLGAGTSSGCLGKGQFRCTEGYQCGPGGYCEASTNVCSFDDTTCQPSGRRYGKHAGEQLSGTCVDDTCQANPVDEVRAGGAHACIVRQSGDVACWGAGLDGQLGDGSARSRSSPAPVAAVDGFQHVHALALGGRHTCALLQDDGSVWCWGANDAGQLGQGDNSPRPKPTRIEGLSGIASIAAGGAFTCAVGTDGSVACWGRNVDGELGLGGLAGPSVLTPTTVSTLAGVQVIAARDRHACALTGTGRVTCWGANEQGELGDGTRTSRASPVDVTALGDRRMIGLGAGSAHTCAIESGGALWCWGANQLGELGDGTNESHSLPTPVPLLSLEQVKNVVAAGHHTCARQANGTAWCWGANQAGQLGEGTTGNIGVPVPVTGIEDAADLTAGDTFSCARRNNGTVWCWGDDRTGQLGTGLAIDRTTPMPVRGLDRAQGITAGGAHTCALRPGTDGAATAVCWGENQAGQLGDGTRLDRAMPVDLKINLNAREVVAGMMHSCLRAGDRSVWCWGRGGSGQLGNATLIDVVVPTNVSGLTDSIRLAAGRSHTCVLQQVTVSPPQARVLCWGANDDGQLGDGSTVSRPAPVNVVGVSDAVDLAVGGAHTCVLRGDGTVSCWGRGLEGQLGNATFLSSTTPVAVAEVTNAIDLAAGDRHTCAVLDDENKSVYCWGDGNAGQLGWGALAPREIPAKVMDLTGAVEVTAGDRHTCARTTVGAVHCWGENVSGQLGNGTRTNSMKASIEPVPASSVDPTPLSALALAAGGAHSCALRSDQSVVCWGSDAAGQLGEGATLQYNIAKPVQISCP